MEKGFLVVGLARSGIACANMLARKGLPVFGFDHNKKLGCELLANKILDARVQVALKLKSKLLKKVHSIVLSPGVPPALFCALSRRFDIPLFSELEIAYRHCPCPVLAVTGTNGKTTTTMLLASIIEEAKHPTFAVGNVGQAFSGEVEKMTPDSVAVCEVSSFQLEYTEQFKPKIIGFLNLAPDHLDRYKTLEDYYQAKQNIFKNAGPGSICVLNFDDERVADMAPAGAQNLFFSWHKLPAGISGAYLSGGKIVFVNKGKKEGELEIKKVRLKGRHNLQNIMCAALMAKSFGVELEKIASAVYRFNGVPHRLEFVKKIGKLSFYNDSKATNIHSCLSALQAFDTPVILLAGGSDKKENFARLFTQIPPHLSQVVAFGECGKKIYRHALAAGFSNITRVTGLEQAFDFAVRNAQEGDTILLSPACASFDEFDNFEQRGDFFKFMVRELAK